MSKPSILLEMAPLILEVVWIAFPNLEPQVMNLPAIPPTPPKAPPIMAPSNADNSHYDFNYQNDLFPVIFTPLTDLFQTFAKFFPVGLFAVRLKIRVLFVKVLLST